MTNSYNQSITAYLRLCITEFFQERQFATMKSCIGELEAAVKKGKQEEVDKAKQQLLAEGTILFSSIISGVLFGVLSGIFPLSGVLSVLLSVTIPLALFSTNFCPLCHET